ncbi:MAG TPA: DddA-like double-stranded DNA deaminase toxin [Pseudonocardiaceae bacterium]|nr:DddA-like double-stranded DNA deaminase toxin [Pseudonocardiaceae bacterium]
MGKLLGRVVLVAVVALGVWYVLGHYQGATTFGCQASGTVAHADSGDCPTSVDIAGSDPHWAASRWSTIKDAKVTTGLFYDQDGHEHQFTSGEDTDADQVSQILRDAGATFPRGATTHPAATHVETKAAARMRDNGVATGVIVINNSRGVCGGANVSSYGCANVLPIILPRNATLVVWWRGPNGMVNARFIGQ